MDGRSSVVRWTGSWEGWNEVPVACATVAGAVGAGGSTEWGAGGYISMVLGLGKWGESKEAVPSV
jgi:hypothetical protein